MCKFEKSKKDVVFLYFGLFTSVLSMLLFKNLRLPRIVKISIQVHGKILGWIKNSRFGQKLVRGLTFWLGENFGLG